MGIDVVNVNVGEMELKTDIPEMPKGLHILPGGARHGDYLPNGEWDGGVLAAYHPSVLLGQGEIWNAVRCKEIRDDVKNNGGDFYGWAVDNYTWNQFAREVNHISHQEAVNLAVTLLNRDVLHEINSPNGLLHSGNTDGIVAGMSLAEYMVAWMRIANRYAWYERAMEEIPDPLYDPIPPIHYAGMETVERIFKNHVQPYLKDVFYKNGVTRVLDVFSAAVLYVFGYQAEKPGYVDDETWVRAVNGLLNPPHFPLTWMIHSPGNYLNRIGVEEENGHNAFFPTPINVCFMMGEMMCATKSSDYEEMTPEERKQTMLERVNDPCVGTGNMAWPMFNHRVLGEFMDVSPTMVNASRALFAMYCPWFTHFCFRGNSLADVGEEALTKKREQTIAYAREEIRAEVSWRYYFNIASAYMAEMDSQPSQSKIPEHIRGRAEARRVRQSRQQLDKMSRLFDLLTTNKDETQLVVNEMVAVASDAAPGQDAPVEEEELEEFAKEAVQPSLFDLGL